MSLPEELLRRLDEFCKRLNIPRSEYIAKVLEERFGEAAVVEVSIQLFFGS
ncbi:MAG: ribbon-helix-helix domain-containing protein [Candidatus Bathyarchaeia archaeon]